MDEVLDVYKEPYDEKSPMACDDENPEKLSKIHTGLMHFGNIVRIEAKTSGRHPLFCTIKQHGKRNKCKEQGLCEVANQFGPQIRAMFLFIDIESYL